MKLLDEEVWLIFLNYWTCAEWLYHFLFPPAMYKRSSFCASLSAFGVVTVLDFSLSNRCVLWNFIVFICSFLMAYDVSIFSYVYFPFVYLFWLDVFRSFVYFLIMFFNLLIVEFEFFAYLGVILLYQIRFC